MTGMADRAGGDAGHGNRTWRIPLAGRAGGIMALLVVANLAAWGWALVAFETRPILLGTALLAYGFGLRHAVDADHIAAIDNVTRKMMQEGKRPVAVGLFFSLGHSTIVVLASVALALTATRFRTELDAIKDVGGMVGTLVSCLFLVAIAVMNLFVLRTIWRSYRRLRAGGGCTEQDLAGLPQGGGMLARVLRPCFALMRRSWHMYPLGVLFGLGFDTATEIGLLGISATEASHGLPVWSILVFPALFTAGMSLIDTADSLLMLGTYGWAFHKPKRKLVYNLAITSVSIAVALLVGGIEALGLLGDQFSASGAFWSAVDGLNDHFGTIGAGIIGLFVVSWAVSVAVSRRGEARLGADLG